MNLLYTTKKACQALNIGKTSLYKIAKERGIKPQKIGRATRWRVTDVRNTTPC